MISEPTNYADQVLLHRDYSSIQTFEYLEAMAPGFQASGIYRPHALEEERGSLSWGASLIGRSYLRMYEKNCDHRYLRAFIGIGEQLLLARDSVRGVTDYRGESNPVWRSGRPYTTNMIALNCGNCGSTCLKMRAKQASRLRIDNIRPATASFDVAICSDTPGVEAVTFLDVSVAPGAKRNISNVLEEQGWKYPQAAAVVLETNCAQCLPSEGEYVLEEQYYAPAAHVSQIVLALLEFARLVNADKDLRAIYGIYSMRYVEAAVSALEIYEPDYRIQDGSGHYVIAEGAPSDFEGTDAPLNHNMSMALCFMLLYRINGKAEYKMRASQILKTFRASLTELRKDGSDCLVWPYFASSLLNYRGHSGGEVSRWRSARKGNTRMEDMSHAVLAVEAAVEAHGLGLEISSHDLKRMANTFLAACATGSLSNYMDGSAGYGKYDNVAGRWAILTPWDKRVFHASLGIMQATQPQPIHASVLLAAANLIATAD